MVFGDIGKKVTPDTITKIILGVILISVLLQIIVDVLPTLITAITNISAVPNFAYASFFSGTGIVLKLLSVGLLIALLFIFLPTKAGKR